MKFLIICFLLITITSCGDTSTKSDKAGSGATNDEFNIGIDTAAITTKESLLEAARAFKAVKDKEEANKESPSYKKHYYTILKYKGILSKKMAAITDTMPGGEKAAFVKLYREILP